MLVLFKENHVGWLMKLSWDWRFARLIDGAGNIVDESIWSSGRNPTAVAKRLSLLTKGRMTDEARRLSERFPEAVSTPVHE